MAIPLSIVQTEEYSLAGEDSENINRMASLYALEAMNKGASILIIEMNHSIPDPCDPYVHARVLISKAVVDVPGG